MKVFQINEYDWVVAKSKQEAIEYYEKETGEPVDKDSVKECNIEKEGMFDEIELDDAKALLELLANGERDERKLIFSYGTCGLYVWKSFKNVLERYKFKEPCIIASTEY